MAAIHSVYLWWFCLIAAADPIPLAYRHTSAHDHSTPLTHVQYEGEEVEDDVFTQILKSNKGSTMTLYHGDIAKKLNAGYSVSKSDDLWEKSADGIVRIPYSLSPEYSDDEQRFIVHVLQDFSTLTCVHLVERSTEEDFLNISSGSGCWSVIGKAGGAQYLSVMKSGCMARGVIQHEIQHALGFYHEQSRSDRDDYIDVMWEYINKDDWSNFEKVETENMGLPYDYSSVMHYGKYSYTNTSEKQTLIPKPDPTVEIGQRYGLSSLDVARVNKLYKCQHCGFLLAGSSGSLDSDKYKSAYESVSSCIWLIRVDKKVLLQFDTFDVAPSADCSSHYITVYDGSTKDFPVLLDKVCGNDEIPLLVSSTNAMLVEYVYGDTPAVAEFAASYSSVSCGGTYMADNGTITSPGYPSLYPNFSDCLSTIWAPAGYKITLNFTTFDLEYSSSCLYDYLIINDGSRPSSPELGRFCWDIHIPTIMSSGNVVLLQFHTDSWFNRAGYQAQYYFDAEVIINDLRKRRRRHPNISLIAFT